MKRKKLEEYSQDAGCDVRDIESLDTNPRIIRTIC